MSEDIFLVCLHEENLIGTKQQIKADIENNYGDHANIEGDTLYRCGIVDANGFRDIKETVLFQKFTDLRASS